MYEQQHQYDEHSAVYEYPPQQQQPPPPCSHYQQYSCHPSETDLGCYGLNDFAGDVNSLEPSIYPSSQQHPQAYTTGIITRSPSSHTSSEEGDIDHQYWHHQHQQQQQQQQQHHPYKRPSPSDAMAAASAAAAALNMTPSVDFDCRSKKCSKLSGASKKQRKPKRDPNEPQKPVSAYALFFRDTQAAIKGQNPNASFGEVSKIVASMWDSLDVDAKNSYKYKTETAKKDYLKQLAAYRANQVSRDSSGLDHHHHMMHESTADSTAGLDTHHQHQLDHQHHQLANNYQHDDEYNASVLGCKSLASLIAEPAPQQVLTATTTLTVSWSCVDSTTPPMMMARQKDELMDDVDATTGWPPTAIHCRALSRPTPTPSAYHHWQQHPYPV